MNPEIKAAIEKISDEVSRTVFQPCLRSMISRTIANENGKELYIAGAEYGYKLGLLVGKMEVYSVNDWTSKLYNAQVELQEILDEK